MSHDKYDIKQKYLMANCILTNKKQIKQADEKGILLKNVQYMY